MARSEFEVKEQWIGTGDLSAYTFNYKIEALLHLLLYVQDSTGALVAGYPIRGDDIVLLSSVTFDSIGGGGTINLASVLPTDYVLTALLANDAPTQPSEYQTKASFTLPSFEAALDFLGGAIQRLAYMAQRSFRIHDLEDADDIDTMLPVGFSDNPGATLAINADGNGFAYGATLNDIASAEGYATAAAAARDAASASAIAAAISAAAAAASAAAASAGMTMYGTYAGPLNITAAGGITSNIPGEQGQFIHGSPGAVIVTANPQISAGTAIGQRLQLIGVDDTNTVKFTNGNGLRLNGDITLGDGDLIRFFWDGTSWQEEYRNAKI